MKKITIILDCFEFKTNVEMQVYVETILISLVVLNNKYTKTPKHSNYYWKHCIQAAACQLDHKSSYALRYKR